MQNNIWIYLFFALLVVSVLIIAYQDMRRSDEPLLYYKDKYEELRHSYVELAKSHSYLLETIMKNDIALQPYLPEYAQRSKDEYLEYLRRRIVAMQMETERLERPTNGH
jgi:transcriptional antiterminator Rof (Rho-off)